MSHKQEPSGIAYVRFFIQAGCPSCHRTDSVKALKLGQHKQTENIRKTRKGKPISRRSQHWTVHEGSPREYLESMRWWKRFVE